MDFMNRGVRTNQTSPQQSGQSTSQPAGENNKSSKFSKHNLNWNKIGSAGFLTAIVILVVATILAIGFGKGNSESKYVDDSKMQAVFLNGGQVYFGNITDLNNKFMRVNNIYYLRVNQQVQPDGNASQQNDISLVKLGCELHGPQDEMLINREQIIFWENLKSDGQVAKAVEEYVKQNPDGQDCNTASSAPSTNNTNTNTNTPTTNSTNNNSNTGPSNGTGTGTGTTNNNSNNPNNNNNN